MLEIVKGNRSLEDINVKQAMGLIKVCILCERKEGIEMLKGLSREDLLVPEKKWDILEGGV